MKAKSTAAKRERERHRLPVEARCHGLGGHRDGEGDRYEKRDADPQPAGIDPDGKAAGLVHALEELHQRPHVHDPEGEGREAEQEAVDQRGAGGEHDREQERIRDPDLGFQARDAVADHGSARHDVDGLPDPDVADAHEHLRVLGLRQREVQLPVAHFLHQALHVRLDGHADHPAEHDLDAHHHQDFRLAPAVQLRRLRVDERKHDERRADRDSRLQQLDEEVRAVLQLVHRADPEVEPGEAEGAHQLPTEEKRRTASRKKATAATLRITTHSA